MNTEQPETHQYPRHSHSDPEYGTTAPHFSEAKISIYHMWSSRFFSNTGVESVIFIQEFTSQFPLTF